jgi:hypothetical protein
MGQISIKVGVNIAGNPTTKSAKLSLLAATSIIATDSVSKNPATVTSLADSTGFPMRSQAMVFLSPDLASTYGNYPNPFSPGPGGGSTTIEFDLQSPANYKLVIYDVLGQRVKTFQSPGPQVNLQRLTWDGKNDMGNYVLNGIYYSQLTVDGGPQVPLLKIAVVK